MTIKILFPYLVQYFRFKRNGCYKEHIVILAQLNAVDACVIEKILHKNGLYDNGRTIRNRERTNK